MTLPRTTIEGALVVEPEIRFSATGKAWGKFRVACNDRQKAADGSWTDGDTTYLTVICFGRQAENLAESVRKGDTIMASGVLQQREWTDDGGVTRRDFDLKADQVAVSVLWHPAKTPKALEDSPGAVVPATVDPWT